MAKPLMEQRPERDEQTTRNEQQPPAQELKQVDEKAKPEPLSFDAGVMVQGAAGVPLSLAQVKSATIEALRKQPKEAINAPVLTGNKAPKFMPITLNGVTFLVKRGVSVQVPAGIAEVFRNAVVVPSTNEPNVREPGVSA